MRLALFIIAVFVLISGIVQADSSVYYDFSTGVPTITEINTNSTYGYYDFSNGTVTIMEQYYAPATSSSTQQATILIWEE